jgi:hypothetical protein
MAQTRLSRLENPARQSLRELDPAHFTGRLSYTRAEFSERYFPARRSALLISFLPAFSA